MNKYRTFGWRVLALLVDSLVMLPLVLPLTLLNLEPATWAFWFIGLGVSILSNAYNILMHWRFGQTLGKMAVGVKVVDFAGEGRITLNQAVLRDLPNIAFQVMSSFAIFYLLISRADPQAEAYKLAETYPTYGLFIFTMLNVFVCITNVQNRALHDILAGTVAIRLERIVEMANDRSLAENHEEIRGE